ncbi:hypothetical protein FQN54_003042 [Arachnomyces sp. PD_36]|nr:hypothetical protein FQN54_003042 [Arachnomyces sp. PD_36]
MDRKDDPGYHRSYPSAMSSDINMKTTPMVSPTSMYASGAPQPPYSSFPSSANSAPSGNPAPSSAGYSPSDPRRPAEEENRDLSQSQSQSQSQSRPHPTPHQQQNPQKQSLPSIKEALGHDDPYTSAGPTSVPPQSQHPPSSHLSHAAPAPPPSSTLVSRPNPEAPLGPPNPFSAGSPSTPYAHHSTTVPHSSTQTDAQRSGRMSINSQDSRNQSLPSLTTGKSPSQSSRTGAGSLNSQNSTYEYGAPPPPGGNMSSPSSYYPSTGYSYQGSATYPAPGLENRPAYLGAPWKPSGPDAMHVDDGKGMFQRSNGSAAQPHSESVKRHLDSYDVESSLNEIIDGSARTLEFSRTYGDRAHHTQRTGPVLGSLPTLQEVEDMLQLQSRNADALSRIRNAVLTQNHALEEQRQRQQQQQQRHHYKDGGYPGDAPVFQDDFKSVGGFSGSDAKKRRGKAAPPGRCHSCNRAETPEWRRGPDGARTLCNACGLHYAKLTRKLGAKQASSLGSNLQPKRGSGVGVGDTTSPPRHLAAVQGPPPPPPAVQPATHHHHHQHM